MTTAAAARIETLLAGEQSQRASAYEELAAVASVELAKACVASLVNVLCAPEERIGSAEAQRAYLVLGGLMLLDPVAVGAELLRGDQMWAAGSTPGNALAAMLAKPTESLTRDDLMLAACDSIPYTIMFAKGWTAVVAATGQQEHISLATMMTSFWAFPARSPTDDRNLKLAMLALDVCREQSPPSESRSLSDLELAAVWNVIEVLICQRAVVCAAAVEAGLYEVAMAWLHKSSPKEWIDWRTAVGLQASGIFHSMTQPCLTLTNAEDVNMTKLMVDSGAAAAVISALQAHELRGASKIGEANLLTIVAGMYGFTHLDLTGPQGEPLVALLAEVPSALRFALDYPLEHVKCIGVTSASLCATFIALVFGKEEADENGPPQRFAFTADMLEDTLANLQDCLTGLLVPFLPELSALWLRPLVHLTISDTNKALLVQSKGLIPLLLDAVFLDEEHARKGAPDSMKAPIQVRKRHFLRHLYLKCIILPRQARDKHRENSKKKSVSSPGRRSQLLPADCSLCAGMPFASARRCCD